MKAFRLLIFTFLIALVNVKAETADYTELCRLFAIGTTLRVPGSCDQYIKCNSGERQVHSCVTPKSFDVQKQICIEALESTSLCGNRCEGINGKWVADPTNCHGYFYCQNGVALPGKCNDGMHFDQTKQMCVYTDSSICVDVSHICETVPDKTKFRDETDCSKYYECSKQTHSRKNCPKNQYFNVELQKCVAKTTMTCDRHPIPSGICVVKKKPFKGFKSDQASCRGYFYCADLGIVEDLEPLWGQCPEGKFFSEEHQSCVDPVDAKCDYNRCEGRGNRMVASGLANKNNCHNYLVCKDGFVKEEKTCPRDYFFNEEYQACVADIIEYNCCDIPVKTK